MTKIHIGKFVELFDERCNIPNLTVWDVSGINKDKEFFEPSKQVGVDSSAYKIVPPSHFACNLMHVGRDVVLPISLNHTEKNKIVSPAYTVFKITDEKIILKEYFFVMLKSNEKDRFFWFNTDSSIRDGMSWDVFCDLEIDLPPIPIQQKYVDVYNAMVANQRAYENGLDELKLTCQATIEAMRRNNPVERVGDYIELRKEKNTSLSISLEQGINIDKQFITPQRSNANLSSRVVVRTGQIAYCTQLNNQNVAIAYRDGCDCVVSPVYEVFEVTRIDELLPEYLMMWLIRAEFGRYVYWASEGSAYEFLRFDNIREYRIPIPDPAIQQSIVNIYKAYTTRREISQKLKAQIKDICPILIKGSLEEARAGSRMKVGAAWN